jgi:hypothetical protein
LIAPTALAPTARACAPRLAASALLERDGEHQPVEVRDARQRRQHRAELGLAHVDRHQHRVECASPQLPGDHLRRAHLSDRVADDAEETGAAVDEVQLVRRCCRYARVLRLRRPSP